MASGTVSAVSGHIPSFYTPIDKSSKNIRLLRLLPGAWPDPIRCDLFVASLGDDPRYDALSYVWGDAGITTTISVNGRERDVTINLEAALRHIRKPNESVIIWVDAVCINQQDLDEKLHQVALMGDIYSSCSHCYIWLGCPAEYFQSSTRSLDEPALRSQETQSNPFAFFDHFRADKHLFDLPSSSDDPNAINFWNAFKLVTDRTWWTRVWTVQEAVLSPSATLLYGLSPTTWENIVVSMELLYHHKFHCCLEAWAKARYSTSTDIHSTVRRLLHQIEQIQFLAEFLPGRELEWKEGPPLLRRVVRDFQDRNSFDPRDRIYGMLGFCGFGRRLGIIPDYTLEAPVVFADAFRKMIVEHVDDDGDLNAFVGSGFNSGYGGLPSWVPNFGNKVSSGLLTNERERMGHLYYKYDASKQTKATPSFGPNNSLSLQGVAIDTVKSVWPMDYTGFWEAHEKLDLLKRQVFLQVGGDTTAKEDKFWSTVMADIVFDTGLMNYTRLEQQHLRDLYLWLGGLDPAQKKENVASKVLFRSSLCTNLNGRAFLVTASGAFGIGPQETKPGDCVYVLFGGKVPFILRESKGAGEGRFRLSGDGFVHGFMDGEALGSGNSTGETVVIV